MAESESGEETTMAARRSGGDQERTFADVEVEDPDGVDWQDRADAAWAFALDQATLLGGEAIEFYRGPDLPRWKPTRAVRREVLGRFLEDRALGVVHDVSAAEIECRVDDIRGATFYHFAKEVPGHLRPCPRCVPG